MKLILKSSQEGDISVEGGVDSKGNDAPIENLAFESTNPDILAMTVSEDGKMATVKAVGPVGSAQVRITADAVVGEGEEIFDEVIDVDVIAGQATGFKVSVGTPREQAPA